jgi:trk system potassium uptake protein TrkH
VPLSLEGQFLTGRAVRVVEYRRRCESFRRIPDVGQTRGAIQDALSGAERGCLEGYELTQLPDLLNEHWSTLLAWAVFPDRTAHEVNVIRAPGAFNHPARLVLAAFGVAVAVGTSLLMLPVSHAADPISLVDAFFTATSAVSVTGLTVVDTGTHWSIFGQIVILILIQIGGLGIMTLATLFALMFFRRAGLRTRKAVAVETKAVSLSDLRGIVVRIAVFTLVVEIAVFGVIAWRLATAYSEGLTRSLYDALFLAVSAFNNAGFSPYPGSVERFVEDPWVLGVITVAVIIGGLGFPVVLELVRCWRTPKMWSILTRVTLAISGILLVLGTVAFWIAENDHQETFATVARPQQWVLALFTSAMTRTAGFNAVPEAALQPESLFVTNVFMFIGGGSAGTAGGIKVTTIGLLLFVVWAEIRGRTEAKIGSRRISLDGQRQALSVVTLSAGVVAIFTFAIMALTPFTFEQVLFEVISAFGTVGLSLGITPELADPAKVLIALLMFIGRLGPLTLAVALAARSKVSLVRLPEERMIVG